MWRGRARGVLLLLLLSWSAAAADASSPLPLLLAAGCSPSVSSLALHLLLWKCWQQAADVGQAAAASRGPAAAYTAVKADVAADSCCILLAAGPALVEIGSFQQVQQQQQ